MGKITQALVKAKERTGQTTAPFPLGDDALAKIQLDREKALRKARRSRIFWSILAPPALALTLFVLWSQIKEVRRPTGAASTPSVIVPPAAGVASPPPPNGKPPEDSAPKPSKALQDTVDDWIIGAVQSGENPRMIFEGRIIHIGDPVNDELTFAGVVGDEILFRDSVGSVYRRKY
jgi:hypothetical protein